MWKNTFLYFIVGNYLRLHSLALLGPEGRERGGGGKVTPIISILFWFSFSHFERKKTIWNSFENTCLINWSKDKKITRESLDSESSKSPPKITEHLDIYVLYCITPTVQHFPNQMLPPVILYYLYSELCVKDSIHY